MWWFCYTLSLLFLTKSLLKGISIVSQSNAKTYNDFEANSRQPTCWCYFSKPGFVQEIGFCEIEDN